MKSLYALIVGINEYRTPLKKLRGCIHDVDNITTYIDSLSDEFILNTETLTNREATYDNVVDRFENHLGHATSEDVVWFHFSGHGSEEYAAPEFKRFDPGGKDQTILCYDSRPGESQNLSDKEIAALIFKVANFFPNGSAKKKPPHILVSLDCCHSGSGTRSGSSDIYTSVRNARAFGRHRNLDSYLQGFYIDAKDDIEVPFAPHYSLSACDRNEEAGDSSEGGAFTKGLLSALSESKGSISYADLYLKTRAAVKKIRSYQHPKFSFIADTDPNTKFLSDQKSGEPPAYPVYYKKGKWNIKCGAVHGLNAADSIQTAVEIHSQRGKKIGSATILSIGAYESILEIDMAFSLKSNLLSIVRGMDEYRGIIRAFPVRKEVIYFEEGSLEHDELISQWDASENIIFSNDAAFKNNIGVYKKTKYAITDLNLKKEVFVSKDISETSYALQKMVKWYRFLELTNSDPLSAIKKRISCDVLLHNAKKEVKEQIGNTLVIHTSYDLIKNEKLGVLPKVFINNGSRDYYFYLFYMDDDYSISCPEEEMIFRGDSDGDRVTDHDEKIGLDGIPDSGDETDARDSTDFNPRQQSYSDKDFANDRGVEIDLWKEVKGLAPANGAQEFKCFLKLLVTTQEVDYFQFVQSGIGTHRSQKITSHSTSLADDWDTFTIELNIQTKK